MKEESMKRTLHVIVAEMLAKNKRKQFTAHEIADMIVKTEHEFVAKKIKRTLKSDKELVFQLMSEIGAQYPKLQRQNIAKTADRPCKYFYQKQTAAKEQAVVKEKAPAKAKAKATAKKAKAVAKKK